MYSCLQRKGSTDTEEDFNFIELEKPVSILRRKNMQAIRSKNTKPEWILRRLLWNAGIRYRIHAKNLPGRPDIYIKKYKLAIFVDGEFWHGYEWDKNKERIHTRREFWISKIESNMKRDVAVNLQLDALGYKVFRFWAEDLKKNGGAAVKVILDFILEAGSLPGKK